MKARELRELTKEDLKNKLFELRAALMKENAQIAVGTTPKSPGSLKATKKTIATIKQILSKEE